MPSKAPQGASEQGQLTTSRQPNRVLDVSEQPQLMTVGNWVPILDYIIFFFFFNLNLILQDEIRGIAFDTTILGNKTEGNIENTSS